MLITNQKKKLAAKFEEWCREGNIPCCAISMIAFLQVHNLLNEEKTAEYLSSIDTPIEVNSGLKDFAM